MKAILRWGVGLVGLVLITAAAHGYVWVTPVTKCPYPQAPSPSNTGFYLWNAQGYWTGPHYYLVPPFQPFGGVPPGATGRAIMSGNLPHTLLMSKDGMNLGHVPYLQQPPRHGLFHNGGGGPIPGAGMPEFGNPSHQYGPPQANMQMPYGMAPPPYANMQVPYGMAPPPYANMQVPYGMAPQQPYAAMPYGMPYAGMPYGTPAPYPAPIAQPTAWQSQPANVWQTQHGPHAPPFAPIPNFNPHMHRQPMPMAPMMPLAPLTPPYPQMEPFAPMQPPRMDGFGPPPPKAGGNAFPMHPFTRSPRDFFMWGEAMEDEQKMRNRPFPVPR